MGSIITDPWITRNGPLSAACPEALCSVNIRFHVEGYADAQATGRGATPEEAAMHLKATMDATREALAPAPAPTREERLSQLLTCGTLKALKRGDFALVERLTKAFVMVVKGMVEPTERAGATAVRSMQDAETWYTVEGTSCSCPDWGKHARLGETTYKCKHGLAVLFAQKLTSEGY